MSNIIDSVNKHANKNTIHHVLYGYYFRGMSMKDLSEIYHKDGSAISRLIKRYEEEGDVERKKSVTAMYRKFSEDERMWLVNLFNDQPILHQNEAALLFFQQFHLQISTSSISAILSEAGLTWKVLERRAIQIQIEDILRFCDKLSSFPWLLKNLVFLDELGFDNKSMMRKRLKAHLPELSSLAFVVVFLQIMIPKSSNTPGEILFG